MSKGGGAKIPTTGELKELAEFENTINNPNVSNMFGSQQFTRGADGRQTAEQQLSPALQGLMENVFTGLSNGPSQFQPQGNQYTQDMIDGFSQRVGQRAGFNPSSYEGMQVQEPTNFTQPESIGSLIPTGPAPNGTPIESGWDYRPPSPGGGGAFPSLDTSGIQVDGITRPPVISSPANKDMSYQDPSPNNGVEVGTGRHKIDWQDKLKQIGQVMQGYGGGR